jgi:hypothetical protein
MSTIGTQVIQEQENDERYNDDAPIGRIEALVGMTDEELEELAQGHGFASYEAMRDDPARPRRHSRSSTGAILPPC